MSRRAGLTIPLFSIRTSRGWGLGEIPDLEAMARWAQRAGFGVLQMLPVFEAAPGQASPYFARTAFALDPAYLRLEDVPDFVAAGGVGALPEAMQKQLDELAGASAVQWGPVRAVKQAALEIAFDHFERTEQKGDSDRAAELARFADESAHWLEDYALFAVLGEAFQRSGGWGGWESWPQPLASRDPRALDAARTEHARGIRFHRYVQWLLDGQWRQARRRVGEAGVTLMGDLPFMVAGDSADVWQRAHEFRLDAAIGVPPDAFSADGQDWGLPVFRWDVMKEHDYAWMRARAERAAALFGLYRIDHVIGLYRTWFIETDKATGRKTRGFVPADEAAQIAQGERLITLLKGAGAGSAPSDDPALIAEDLGVVPDWARASLTRLGVPGYKVLRWEVDQTAGGPVFRDPARFPALSVATTGTHDTESLAEWYESLTDEMRRAFLALPFMEPVRAAASDRFDFRVRDAALASAWASGSDLVLVPFQDCFGHRERVNVPGTLNEHNWSYRMPITVDELQRDTVAIARLARLAALR